ncbi:hypothetical protein PIB30_079881, partial [Stylosanthes scabra]|nr:hypothetical protein [Stylosanthes scabra]
SKAYNHKQFNKKTPKVYGRDPRMLPRLYATRRGPYSRENGSEQERQCPEESIPGRKMTQGAKTQQVVLQSPQHIPSPVSTRGIASKKNTSSKKHKKMCIEGTGARIANTTSKTGMARKNAETFSILSSKGSRVGNSVNTPEDTSKGMMIEESDSGCTAWRIRLTRRKMSPKIVVHTVKCQ